MERAFAHLDRDAGLEIAERSHQARQRVQGSSYFYGELDLQAQLEVLARADASKVIRPCEASILLKAGRPAGSLTTISFTTFVVVVVFLRDAFSSKEGQVEEK